MRRLSEKLIRQHLVAVVDRLYRELIVAPQLNQVSKPALVVMGDRHWRHFQAAGEWGINGRYIWRKEDEPDSIFGVPIIVTRHAEPALVLYEDELEAVGFVRVEGVDRIKRATRELPRFPRPL